MFLLLYIIIIIVFSVLAYRILYIPTYQYT